MSSRVAGSLSAAPSSWRAADAGGRRRAGRRFRGCRCRSLERVDGRRRAADARSEPVAARAAPHDRAWRGRTRSPPSRSRTSTFVRRRRLPAVLAAADQRRTSSATSSATARALGYTFERGGKRDKRTHVARTRPRSPGRTSSIRSASCASRRSRHSSRRCSPSRRWISRSRTSRASPRSSRSTGSACSAGDLARGRLLQDLAAEAAVRAGRLGRRSRRSCRPRRACGS